MVAVDQVSLVVDEDDPIGVAVQSHPNICSGLEDHSANHFRMERAAVEVDILAIWLYADGNHLGSQFFEDRGSHSVCRTVCTVQHDFHPVKAEIVGKCILQKDNIPSSSVIDAKSLPHFSGRRPERMNRV